MAGKQAVVRYAHVGFFLVVIAALISGTALMVLPAETSRFFSWGLAPPPLAALVGGLYLASAVTFGVAIRLPYSQFRSLLVASVVLTLPTLVATLMHLDVFDFGRWQAWAWVALFTAAPLFWAGVFLAGRPTSELPPPPSPRRPEAGAVLTVAAVLGVAGAVVWVAPSAGAAFLPMELPALGGRFIGAWLGFLSVMTGWVALVPDERRLPLIALASYTGGALIAGLRTFGALSPPANRFVYLLVLGVAFVVSVVALGRVVRVPAESHTI